MSIGLNSRLDLIQYLREIIVNMRNVAIDSVSMACWNNALT